MNDVTRLRDGLAPRGDDGQEPPRSGNAGPPRSGNAGPPRSGNGGLPPNGDAKVLPRNGSAPAHSPAAAAGGYAALDLGTNNCRLLIACPTGDGFRVVDSFSRIIRLGEGISATGCISDAAIESAI